MASLTRWAWVWVKSGSWWWTGRPGVLRFMGSQRVRHDWATDLIWSESSFATSLWNMPRNKTTTTKKAQKTKYTIFSRVKTVCLYFPLEEDPDSGISSSLMGWILQARLQQYVNCELPDVQARFRKGRGARDQIANIHWIIEKAREFQKKTSTSALLIMPKPLTVWTTTNSRKFWKKWEYQITWLASWEICMQVRKQLLELDMEQQTGSK